MEGQGVRDVLFKNFRLKLMALVFATALWFFVAGQSNTEVGFLVPLVYKGMPNNMAIAGSPPGEIEVRVSGPKFVIKNLSPAKVIAELDLSDAKEGVNTYKLLPQNITTPVGVDVLRLYPSSVELRIERISEVTLPVMARVRGEPAKGYRVKGVKVYPDSVRATGLKKEIKDLREIKGIYTKPVDVSGIRSSGNYSAALDVVGNEFGTLSTDKVTVFVIIEKER